LSDSIYISADHAIIRSVQTYLKLGDGEMRGKVVGGGKKVYYTR
jgi:hypothetical protein